MDKADGLGISLFALAVLIVTPVLLYPPLKAWLDQRDYRRRMSKAWRESQATGVPLETIKKRRTRRSKSA